MTRTVGKPTPGEKARIIEAWRLGANADVMRELGITTRSRYHINRIITEANQKDNYGVDRRGTDEE